MERRRDECDPIRYKKVTHMLVLVLQALVFN